VRTNTLICELVIACAFGASASAQGVRDTTTELFLRPTGRYAVGTHEYFWTDSSRAEPFTRDTADRRRLIVRVWYPAEATPAAARAPYIRDVREFGDSSRYPRLRRVLTNALIDAPLAGREERYAVLVYQPGGGTARFAGTFEAEQLASHGYVVVAADHPGFSETRVFPDGTPFVPDTLRPPAQTGNLRDDALAFWSYLDRDVFRTWTADGRFVLDMLAVLERTSGQRFHRRLDVERIGMFGWSFGGATSLQMSKDDPRVKAAVDQDGQLFGDVHETGTRRPVLLMHNGDTGETGTPATTAVMKELIAMLRAKERSFLDRSTGDRYELTIPRTQHGHFSDLMLMYPLPPGQLDPRRAHEIITAYTLAFFDRYLRGVASPLLEGAATYPEVTFRKY
jgi:predicted dienelactone hydrolase